MSTNLIANYLNSNEFVEHPMGNYALFGLNFFGSNSVIRYNDEIYKFYAFKAHSKDAIYVNKHAQEIVINPYDKSLQITRMISVQDLKNKAF